MLYLVVKFKIVVATLLGYSCVRGVRLNPPHKSSNAVDMVPYDSQRRYDIYIMFYSLVCRWYCTIISELFARENKNHKSQMTTCSIVILM